MPTSSIARPSKIYPNLDFWFENKPSGNPALMAEVSSDKTNVAAFHLQAYPRLFSSWVMSIFVEQSSTIKSSRQPPLSQKNGNYL
jgi:hypothetical protein